VAPLSLAHPVYHVGLSVGAAWIAGQDRSMWRTLRPSAGQAQQWVSEWVCITTMNTTPAILMQMFFFMKTFELKCLQITTLTVSTTTSGWLLDTTSTIISKSNSYVTWKWWISWQKAEWCQCQRIKAGDPVRSRCFRRSIGLCENRKTGERLDQLRLLRGEGLGR